MPKPAARRRFTAAMERRAPAASPRGDWRRHQPDRLRPGLSRHRAAISRDRLEADGHPASPKPARFSRAWSIWPSSGASRAWRRWPAFRDRWGRPSMAMPAPMATPFPSGSSSVRFSMAPRCACSITPQCEFAYRESVFKRHKEWIVFSAELLSNWPMRPGCARSPARSSRPQRKVPCDHEVRRQHLQEPAVRRASGIRCPRIAARGRARRQGPGRLVPGTGRRQGPEPRRYSRGRLSRQPDLQRRRGHGRRPLRAHPGIEGARTKRDSAWISRKKSSTWAETVAGPPRKKR